MARLRYFPAAFAAVIAAGAMMAGAQEATPPAPPPGGPAPHEAPHPPRAKAAEIRLDFGGGRKISVSCGDADLAACAATIAPLVDKIADMPMPDPRAEGHGGKGKHGKHGKADHGPKGGEHPPKDRPGQPGDAPDAPREGEQSL